VDLQREQVAVVFVQPLAAPDDLAGLVDQHQGGVGADLELGLDRAGAGAASAQDLAWRCGLALSEAIENLGTLIAPGLCQPDAAEVAAPRIGPLRAPSAGLLPAPVLPVTVTIGSAASDVLYSGAAPSLVAGVLQVNARIPAETASGSVPVVLLVGGASSQLTATVAASSAR